MTVRQPPLVAVLNTSQEVLEMLVAALEDDGMRVVADYIVDFKRGHKDIGAFLREHRPQVIVFDIAPPYEENWDFFNTVRGLGATQDCMFVLTTTNKAKLEELVGPTQTFEFVGRPFDLSLILKAVQQALAACEEG